MLKKISNMLLGEGLREYEEEEENKLLEYIPWIKLVEKGIVFNSNNTFQKTFVYDFCDSIFDKNNMNLVEILAKIEGVFNVFFEIKKIRLSNDSSEEIKCFLTLVSVAIEEKKSVVLSKVKFEQILEGFIEKIGCVESKLSEILPNLKELSDEETYTYLHSCISEKKTVINGVLEDIEINKYLCDSNLSGGMRPKLGNVNIAALTLIGSNFNSDIFLKSLNKFEINYRVVVRYLHIKREDIIKLSKKSIEVSGKKIVSDYLNKKNGREIEQGISGFYNCTLLFYGEDYGIIEQNIDNIQKEINELGITTIKESTNNVQCFLGAIPGNLVSNIRIPIKKGLVLNEIIHI